MDLATFLFWLMALATAISAVMVVVTQNIVRAATWLLFSLAGTSGIFFLLGADLVGATQLLVYVGGTLILVVFGVMLTAQGPFITMKTGAAEWAVSAVVGLFLLGVLAILFSFGKGLVFFVPGLLLPLRRTRVGQLCDPARIDLPRAYRSMMLFIAGLILVYGSWWAWNGDVSWGPRFFLIAIFPGSLALAAWLTDPGPPVAHNLAVLAILALSLWIGADSMTFQDLLSPRCYGDMEYCRFDITDSPLWYPLLARPHVGFRATVQLLYHATVFGWLALPRVVRLVRDLARLTRYRRHLLRPSAWQR